MIDTVLSQLTDPFRIGLMVALVITMFRTSAVTGRVIPLALGVLFVAVILPSTLPSQSVEFLDAVVAGFVSNVIILVVVLCIAKVLAKRRG